VGTGRFIFSLDYSDEDFVEVVRRLVAGARAMQADGWWWASPAASNKGIRRRILRELLTQRS
jgi:glutamate-1-semialdehyde 2,1-aminomutase